MSYPRKLKPLPEYGEWACHPDCDSPKEHERLLIDNRDRVEVFAEIHDSDESYSYDEMALVKLDGKLYLLHTSGCSCPSPSETWGVLQADTNLAAVRKLIADGRYPGCTYPAVDSQKFLAQLDAMVASEPQQVGA